MTAAPSERVGVGEALRALSRTSFDDAGKLVLRVLVAGLMFFHGYDKVVHGLAGVHEDLRHAGLPPLLALGSYLGEVVAPVLILLGIWTRPAALVYAGTIVLAVSIVHADDFTHLKPTGAWAAELWVFYIVAPVAVALLGAGRYAFRRGQGAWD